MSFPLLALFIDPLETWQREKKHRKSIASWSQTALKHTVHTAAWGTDRRERYILKQLRAKARRDIYLPLFFHPYYSHLHLSASALPSLPPFSPACRLSFDRRRANTLEDRVARSFASINGGGGGSERLHKFSTWNPLEMVIKRCWDQTWKRVRCFYDRE